MNFGKTFRKVIASVSTIALVFSTIILPGVQTTQAALGVDDSEWFAVPVNALHDAGAITAEMDGPTFDAGADLTRADAVRWIIVAAGLEDDTAPEAGFSDNSGDVYVNSAVFYGIVDPPTAAKGNRFFPADTINRAELTKLLMLGFLLELSDSSPDASFSDVPGSEWFAEHFNVAFHNSVIDGDGNTGGATASPARAVNKAEGAKMIAYTIVASQQSMARAADGTSAFDGVTNLAASLAGSPVEYAAVVETPADDTPAAPVATGGGLSVSMSTYPSASIPDTATSVPFVDYTFTAAGESVTLDGVILHRFGVSAIPASFQGYLYEGASRVTTGRTINSTTNNIVFRNMNLVIAAGSSRTLTFRADMGDTAVGEMGFELVSAEAVESNASAVNGTFPMSANKFDLTDTAGGQITIEVNGTVPNPKVGEQGVTIGKLKASANAVEDLHLQRLGVYVSGTISTGDLKNLELYEGTTLVATTPSVNAQDLAMFVFDTPLKITKGNTKNFHVKADLDTGRGDDTIQVYIDETTDIFAVGATYGFGANVVTTTYDGGTCTSGGANECTFSTVQGGDITIASSGPAAQDIAINADDVHLMDFTLATVSDITVRRFEVQLTATEAQAAAGLLSADSTANFTDIKIVNTETGVTLMGPVDSTAFDDAAGSGGTAITTEALDDATAAWYAFADEFSMDAGEVLKLAFMVDVENTAALADDTLIGAIAINQGASSYPEFRDANNKVVTNSSSVVPGSTITGKTMTIKAPALALALSSTPTSDNTFVKGTQNVTFVCFSASNNDAAAVKLTDLTFTASIDADGGGAFLAGQDTVSAGNVYVRDIVGAIAVTDAAGTVLAPAETVQTNGTIVFDSMNIVFGKGETKQLCATGNISSDAFKNNDEENIGIRIADDSDVTVETSAEGNTVDVTPDTGGVNGTATAPSTFQAVSDGGSLTVAVDPATPKEDILVAATTGNNVSKFKFTATDEAFVVNDLHVTNKQAAATDSSDVADADLGAFDNNVTAIKLTYKNQAGAEVVKSGFLTNGLAKFSGLGLYVPKDDDAVITVSANITSIQSGGTSGEYIDLGLAFHEFDATAMGSGETYGPAKLDNAVAVTSDLDFGTPTYAALEDSTSANAVLTDLAVAAAGISVGSTLSLVVDDGTDSDDPGVILPVGTLICVQDVGNTDACTGTVDDDIFGIVTAYADGDTEDTYTVFITDDGDDDIAVNELVFFSLSGHGYLTETHYQHIHETKPTLAKAASSPAGGRTVSSTDEFFSFTVSANAGEKVQMRRAAHLTTCAAGTGTVTLTANGNGAAQLSAREIDADGCQITAAGTDLDGVSFSVGTVNTLDPNDYASFWIMFEDVGNDSIAANAITLGTVNVYTTDVATASDNDHVLGPANVANDNDTSLTDLDEDIWYFIYDVPLTSAVAGTDTFVGIELQAATAEIGDDDIVYIDQMKVYNDRLRVQITSNDRMKDFSTITDSPIAVSMKEGGATIATAYLAVTDGGVAQADDIESTAEVIFIPDTETIEIAKGTSKTFTLQMNTSTLINGSVNDDLLTPQISLGTSSDGTVADGDFWWYDTNANSQVTNKDNIRWVGSLSLTTLSGSTLYY